RLKAEPGAQRLAVAELGRVPGQDVAREVEVSTVVFKATLLDPDGDQVRLEIELRRFSEPFSVSGVGTSISGLLPSGSQIIFTRSGLSEDSYHWRARAVDAKGARSDWLEFGQAGNVDFRVVAIAPVSNDCDSVLFRLFHSRVCELLVQL